MEIKLICKYCNTSWKLLVWSAKEVEAKCPTCNDSNIKIIEEKNNNTDIYGYNYNTKNKKSESEFDDE